MIVTVPLIVLCITQGTFVIWFELLAGTPQIVLRAVVVSLLLLQWLVGIQVTNKGSAYGPGFEVQPYDRTEVSGTTFRASIGAGAAFPTPEGFRPIFGHAYVLFGGLWREICLEQTNEYEDVITKSLDEKIPILVTLYPQTLVINLLIEQHYTTRDPQSHVYALNPLFTERRFAGANGNTIVILDRRIQAEGSMQDFREIASLSGSSKRVIIVGYPRTVQSIYQLAPETLTKIGPTTAVLDLELLERLIKDHSP
jgi:hypothetical protein